MTDLMDKVKQLGISHFTVHDFVSEIERLQAENKELQAKVLWMEGNTPNWGWPWDAPYTDGYESAKDEFRERIIAAEEELRLCQQDAITLQDKLATMTDLAEDWAIRAKEAQHQLRQLQPKEENRKQP